MNTLAVISINIFSFILLAFFLVFGQLVPAWFAFIVFAICVGVIYKKAMQE